MKIQAFKHLCTQLWSVFLIMPILGFLIPTMSHAGIAQAVSSVTTDGIFALSTIEINKEQPSEFDTTLPLIQQNSLLALQEPRTAHGYRRNARVLLVEATGYSSTIDQTDNSPFITASRTYVRDGVVAANFLPFGSRIKIPGLFGDKIFIVEDRMNKRYDSHIDVWFSSREDAKRFGRRLIRLEIL